MSSLQICRTWILFSLGNFILHLKCTDKGVPIVAQWLAKTRLGTMRVRVRSLASLSRLRIQRCRELWCRSQMWLQIRCCCGSGIGQQLHFRCDPWPGNLHMPRERPQKRQNDKKKERKKTWNQSTIVLSNGSEVSLIPGKKNHKYPSLY